MPSPNQLPFEKFRCWLRVRNYGGTATPAEWETTLTQAGNYS
jgi:hypothetical protein